MWIRLLGRPAPAKRQRIAGYTGWKVGRFARMASNISLVLANSVRISSFRRSFRAACRRQFSRGTSNAAPAIEVDVIDCARLTVAHDDRPTDELLLGGMQFAEDVYGSFLDSNRPAHARENSGTAGFSIT
jgi:hypothetical protein